MEAVFYQNMIDYELGEAAKAARYPRRPADELPPIDTTYRALPTMGLTAIDDQPEPTGWLVRLGRRLTATASIFSL